MKIHLIFSGFQPAIMDIDKKLPEVVKIYPQAKIEKGTLASDICIKGENIINDLKIVRFIDNNVDIPINIDLYAFSQFCHVYFDLSFDLNENHVKILLNEPQLHNAIFNKVEVKIKDSDRNFGVIISEYLVSYFNPNKLLELEKSIENLSLVNQLDKILNKTALQPYCNSKPIFGLTIGPQNHSILLEDYDNLIDTSDGSWNSVHIKDGIAYNNFTRALLLCKNKKYFKDLYEHHYLYTSKLAQLGYANSICRSNYLLSISKQGLDIRSNIIENNRNSYYWKELKKNIEIMDLSFLQFHADIMTICGSYEINNGGLIILNEEYKKYLIKKIDKSIKKTQNYINEVKYAISNLSTPSHTHDEEILQQETEKVNDRILMLSFIAMAVSAIGMMRSLTDLDLSYKIVSGAGIFTLPIVYYLVRSIQKKLSIRKNEKNELKRRLNSAKKQLIDMEKENKVILESDSYPDDFKQEIIKFREPIIVAQRLSIKKLKKQINK